MQLIHSFNHSISSGAHLRLGLFQLLSPKNAAATAQRHEGVSILDQLVIGIGLGAKNIWPADAQHDAPLINRIKDLSSKAGIAPPNKILIYESPDKNAAVLINGTMTLSTGMLASRMPAREMDAIIGHELSHLKRLTSSKVIATASLLVSGAAGIWSYLKTANFQKRAWWKNLAFGITALPVAGIIFEGVSYLTAIPIAAHVRRNEMVADRESAELTGDPGAMADALQRLERDQELRHKYFITEQLDSKGKTEPSTPSFWKELGNGLGAPLRSHPPIHKRIAQLRAMEAELRAQQGGQPQYAEKDVLQQRRDGWRDRATTQHWPEQHPRYI